MAEKEKARQALNLKEFRAKINDAMSGKLDSFPKPDSTPLDVYDHELKEAIDQVDEIQRPTLSEQAKSTAESLARSTRSWSRDFLETSDAKYAFVRDTIANYNFYVDDLGGFDSSSMAQRELAKRAATLGAICRILEARIAEMGIKSDLDPQDFNENFHKYLMATKVLQNVLRSLGTRRKSKVITQDLGEYAKVISQNK